MERTMEDLGADRRQVLGTEAAGIVQALLGGGRRGVPGAVLGARWLDDVHDAALRVAVTVRLRSGLTGAVGAAWARGWQPADLLRAARRTLSADAVSAFAGAVHDELGTYARSTVDPRWWHQLEEVQEAAAQQRRGGRRQPLRRDPTTAWSGECGGLLAATVFVERLPQLQVLGPLPGEAQQPDGEAPTDVDDKLLTKVRRLLAQAEGTPYEAEAETFTAAAQSLMARHRIDRAMLEATDERARRGPGAVRLSVDRPYEQPKMLLLSVIASANRCRALWNQSGGFATVVGHPADRRSVEVLFTSLLVQATTAMQREGERRDVASRSRGFRSSFLSGFAVRIGQRLEEASHCAEDEVRARLEASAASTRPAVRHLRPHGTVAGCRSCSGVATRRSSSSCASCSRTRCARAAGRSVTTRGGCKDGRPPTGPASVWVNG